MRLKKKRKGKLKRLGSNDLKLHSNVLTSIAAACLNCGGLSSCSGKCNYCSLNTMDDCISISNEYDLEQRKHYYNKLIAYINVYAYLRKNKDMTLPVPINLKESYTEISDMSFSCDFDDVADIIDFLPEQALHDYWLAEKLCILSEKLSYPLTILYVLQEVQELQQWSFNPDQTVIDLEESDCLNIHIYSPIIMIDSSIWEFLLHRLPNLKKINIVFIGDLNSKQGEVHRFNYNIKLKRCPECEIKDRLITYSIHPVSYTAFFNSSEYSTPHIVTIFSQKSMLIKDKNCNVSEIENTVKCMTKNSSTILILTGDEQRELYDVIQSIDEIQPTEVLLPIEHNQFKGFSPYRGVKTISIASDREFLTCLRRIT